MSARFEPRDDCRVEVTPDRGDVVITVRQPDSLWCGQQAMHARLTHEQARALSGDIWQAIRDSGGSDGCVLPEPEECESTSRPSAPDTDPSSDQPGGSR